MYVGTSIYTRFAIERIIEVSDILCLRLFVPSVFCIQRSWGLNSFHWTINRVAYHRIVWILVILFVVLIEMFIVNSLILLGWVRAGVQVIGCSDRITASSNTLIYSFTCVYGDQWRVREIYILKGPFFFSSTTSECHSVILLIFHLFSRI